MVSVSVVMPAKNEAGAIGGVVKALKALMEEVEVIVVNDGSSDDTAAVATAAGARVVSHPYSKGNGAAVKTGARAATGEVIVFMDADGQHDPADIARLLEKMAQGHDMVVGARQKALAGQCGPGICQRPVQPPGQLDDRAQGGRLDFGLSCRAGGQVSRISLPAAQRVFVPHHQHHGVLPRRLFGGLRAHSRSQADRHEPHSPAARRRAVFLIIFKIGTLFSPVKIFAPVALGMFLLATGWYGWTWWHQGDSPT
ncbi:glycosyltransferase family 2 protein [Ottowia beijingensis]|uniref:glycosyltransferase family 2 protein n=1 Tax=Ottowia beijingensis TaxID=1207057 RepID=UPI00214D6A24|nr:glycosyltransferase family 2 protein [Ottowia beijingensis]